ncbi:hypothetical protein HK104_004127 [Borealophlyctis nickersoniae]|nr:hypothetical protein HK104_004127 [Borealophlyctis nickersoniae]
MNPLQRDEAKTTKKETQRHNTQKAEKISAAAATGTVRTRLLAGPTSSPSSRPRFPADAGGVPPPTTQQNAATTPRAAVSAAKRMYLRRQRQTSLDRAREAERKRQRRRGIHGDELRAREAARKRMKRAAQTDEDRAREAARKRAARRRAAEGKSGGLCV